MYRYDDPYGDCECCSRCYEDSEPVSDTRPYGRTRRVSDTRSYGRGERVCDTETSDQAGENVVFKHDKDGLSIHITIYNTNNNANEGSEAGLKQRAETGGQISGKEGKNANQGGQIASKGGKNANQDSEVGQDCCEPECPEAPVDECEQEDEGCDCGCDCGCESDYDSDNDCGCGCESDYGCE